MLDNYVEYNLEYFEALDLPPMCYSLFMALMYNVDRLNLVNKGQIANQGNMPKDNRTFNKYWKMLVDNGVIVKDNTPKQWLVSSDYIRHQHLNIKNCEEKWEALNESAN